MVRVVQVVHLVQVVYVVQVVSLNDMNSENMWFTYFSRNRNGELVNRTLWFLAFKVALSENFSGFVCRESCLAMELS